MILPVSAALIFTTVALTTPPTNALMVLFLATSDTTTPAATAPTAAPLASESIAVLSSAVTVTVAVPAFAPLARLAST